MKFTIALSFLFSASSFASNCPDFSGHYLIKIANAVVTVSQKDCKEISITLIGAGTETRIADGEFRDVTDPFGQTSYSSTVFNETRLIMTQMDPTKSFIETRTNFQKVLTSFVASDVHYNKDGKEVYRSSTLFEKIVE